MLLRTGALLILPVVTHAQRTGHTYRVGFLSAGNVKSSFPSIPEELRRLGYEQGRNVTFEEREANGQPEKTAELAAELVASKPDVIVVDLPRPTLALWHATKTIPLVMTFGMVPEELGLVKSLSKPGGNVTGTLIQGPDSAGKTLQIIRDIFPAHARIVFLYEPAYPGLEIYLRKQEEIASLLNLKLVRAPVSNEHDLKMLLASFSADRPNALFVTPTGVIFRNVEDVLSSASSNRLPVLSPTKWMVRQGALFAFEPDLTLLLARAAAIVDKILKGMSPADIPVEAPTKYQLWLNLASASALGLNIPLAVRLQADRVFY